MRSATFSAVYWLAAWAIAIIAGCGARVGSLIEDGPDGARLENPSPNLVIDQDDEASGTATATGPVSTTVIGPTGVRTRKAGSAPFEGMVRTDADTTHFVWSASASIQGTGAKLLDGRGNVLAQADSFAVDAAGPIRALNESLDRLIQYWPQRDRVSAEVIQAELNTVAQVSASLASLLAQAFGVPLLPPRIPTPGAEPTR